MTLLPWRVFGARLQLPRDLQIAYALGRMGLATIADTFRLWYGSQHTCRFGFGRLTRLGLLRSLPREDVLSPAWFSLTNRGLEWTAEQAGCDERELRTVASARRINLSSLSTRNCFWVSIVLSTRKTETISLDAFKPEWKLRQLRQDHIHLVPDAIVSLSKKVTDGRRCAWSIEMDNATERSAVWKAKAAQYAELRSTGDLYGFDNWRLLALVPSVRRAHSVAVAITEGGAGAFSFVGLAQSLMDGRAFDQVLWSCQALTKVRDSAPTASLIDGLLGRSTKPIIGPNQQLIGVFRPKR